MRILVTGAQGCIGAWVVKNLLDRGLDVLIYDADPAPARLALIAPPTLIQKAAVETGRIEDGARLKALVKDGGITHIVHLAAVLMPFCQATPVEGGMVNVIGTLNVFEAARDAGRAVRVVYASSSAVWGPEEAYGGGKLTEDDPLKPSTHYGVFKQANEGNARSRTHRRSHARHARRGPRPTVPHPCDRPYGPAICRRCRGEFRPLRAPTIGGRSRIQPGRNRRRHG